MIAHRPLAIQSGAKIGKWQHRVMFKPPRSAPWSKGMMIAEVNIAIGAIDRILKMIKDGNSNHREPTNARAELDHWRARLLQVVHKG
jgi:hypothetical protein